MSYRRFVGVTTGNRAALWTHLWATAGAVAVLGLGVGAMLQNADLSQELIRNNWSVLQASLVGERHVNI